MIQSARRHRLALGLAAAGSALALAACGADESVEPDDGAAEEAAVEEEEDADTEADSGGDGWNKAEVPTDPPRLDEEDLPDEEPDSEQELSDQIAWAAFKDVAEMAVVVDEDADWQCPDIEGDEGEQVTCTVTYFGEDYDYEVTMEGGGGFIVNYQAELPEGPLVREAAEDAVRYSAEAEEVRCDMDEVVRTPLDTDDVAQCKALDADGEELDYTVDVTTYGTVTATRDH
ncbi:hypothetical protein IDM40_08920 [Nocardiopsis sp. HNM0947]|uniref:DUF4333 domain-containing protein n=1 Tax=Nocardiopsis coralli TaxID=2772213 RepID=A0ABR9P4Q5_9ACTN|nr:hypothetical protein [Nocardiopsis coralli]MBE2998824.1 hypothetical protein [Nocardiopsis coralli]